MSNFELKYIEKKCHNHEFKNILWTKKAYRFKKHTIFIKRDDWTKSKRQEKQQSAYIKTNVLKRTKTNKHNIGKNEMFK